MGLIRRNWTKILKQKAAKQQTENHSGIQPKQQIVITVWVGAHEKSKSKEVARWVCV